MGVKELALQVGEFISDSLAETLERADEKTALYVLFRLAKIAIPHVGIEYDSRGIRLYADVMWELAKAKQFFISYAHGWDVTGSFPYDPFIVEEVKREKRERLDRVIMKAAWGD